jgi:hypothetical protein
MENFDICMLVAFIIIIIITVYVIVTVKYNNKIDNKVKSILGESPKLFSNDPMAQLNDTEPFIVSDAQDLLNYDTFRKITQEMPDNFDDTVIKDPATTQVVDYNYPDDNKDKKAFVTDIDFGQDKPYPVVSCSNSSIINSLTTGPMKLLPGQIECSLPNKLTAENYYKTHYNARSIPMENQYVRGANYMQYSDTPSPYTTNRILSQNTKGLIPSATAYKNIPTGSNYAFYNTPAMPMP